MSFSRLAARIAAAFQGEWKREAFCPQCRWRTTQVRHGRDEAGRLWKGHMCAGKGWECLSCHTILERKQLCCR